MKTALMIAVAATLVTGIAAGAGESALPAAGILDDVEPQVQNEAPNDLPFQQAAEEPDGATQTSTPEKVGPFEEPSTAADKEHRHPLMINSDWYSWKYHGTALGKLAVRFPQTPQPQAPIETREGSVTELTFGFDNPVDPATFTPAAVSICGHNTWPPPPTTVLLDGTGMQATLTWLPGDIPNGELGLSVHDHYVVCIHTSVTDTSGTPLTGDRDVDFVASFGNVRTSGVIGNWQNVNANDRSSLTNNYTPTPTAAQATTFDIRISGVANIGKINANDRAWLVSSYTPAGAALPQVPPPCFCP
ncbi:MAG: hypothetical protein JXB13_14015 [Phycisphaerae bacterium]|nr:hypothetical protein [Phycisphaerae bacterium]